MKKILFNRLVLVALLLGFPCLVYAADLPTKVVGRPLALAVCSATSECSFNKLPENPQLKSIMIIDSSMHDYYWTSRESTPLFPHESGAFINFTSVGGSGYVKISIEDKSCLYMEHLPQAFETYTYWGLCEATYGV